VPHLLHLDAEPGLAVELDVLALRVANARIAERAPPEAAAAGRSSVSQSMMKPRSRE
jgi:hypothetical protein